MEKFDQSKCERLFHGTCAQFDGVPRVGADGVFWAAESSAVAQVYIPKSGGQALICASRYEMGNSVQPNRYSVLYQLACQFGPAAQDVQYDGCGRATSWRCPPGYLNVAQVVERLEAMGYLNDGGVGGDWRSWVLTNKQVVMPANWRVPGRLLMLEGFEQMRLCDISLGDSDLTDLQYKKIGLFDRLAAEGYDGVVIDDFCQSKAWGNVGHRSIGFFGTAIGSLKISEIAAENFDWGPEVKDLRELDSPQYKQWLADQGAEVLREYEPVRG